MSFSGIIKGSPVSQSLQLSYPVYEGECRPVLVYRNTQSGITPDTETPIAICWRWVPRIFRLQVDKISLKVSSGVVLKCGDHIIEIGAVPLTDTAMYAGQGIRYVMEYGVLAPVFLMIFQEPVWISVRGVLIGMPDMQTYREYMKHEKETDVPECPPSPEV